MKILERYLENTIVTDALESHKMAFVSGPRQVGKTTLVESILSKSNEKDEYFNWDDDEFKKIWLKEPKQVFTQSSGTYLALDEIHKDRNWKAKLKGLYDLFKNKKKIIVTGSARLDFYRKSGDSLQGRYFPYRLHPFSVGESPKVKPPPEKDWLEHSSTVFEFEDLFNLGGFPEPFFAQSQEKAQRWRRLHRERMVREDLRDLQNIQDLQLLENLALLLPDKVGSHLSYESLRQDLHCSFDTVKRWIGLLNAVYFSYLLSPYSKNIKNSLKKEPKLYLYEWAALSNDGAKLENMVASHLLKSCHAWTDCAFGEFDLFYIRDKQKREVDFLVIRNQKPYLLIEVKSGQKSPTDSLIHFQKILKPKFTIQLVRDKKSERAKSITHPDISIMECSRFLSALN